MLLQPWVIQQTIELNQGMKKSCGHENHLNQLAVLHLNAYTNAYVDDTK